MKDGDLGVLVLKPFIRLRSLLVKNFGGDRRLGSAVAIVDISKIDEVDQFSSTGTTMNNNILVNNYFL